MLTVTVNGQPVLHTNDPVAAIDVANAIGEGASITDGSGPALQHAPRSHWIAPAASAAAVILVATAGWWALTLREALRALGH